MAQNPPTAFLSFLRHQAYQAVFRLREVRFEVALVLFFFIPGCGEQSEVDVAAEKVAPQQENVQDLAATAGETADLDSEETVSPKGENKVELPAVDDTSDGAAHFQAGIKAYQANDLALAYREFREAAEKGHADSQFNLALMYEQGIGVSKDESQAVVWYDRSASQGNSAAQFNLGVLYENGRGTQVNFAKANQWYRKASVQGDPLAIGNLGMLYIRGQGVDQDLVAGVALLIASATMDPSPQNHAKQNLTATRGLNTKMITSAQELSAKLMSAENLLQPLDEYLQKS